MVVEEVRVIYEPTGQVVIVHSESMVSGVSLLKNEYSD